MLVFAREREFLESRSHCTSRDRNEIRGTLTDSRIEGNGRKTCWHLSCATRLSMASDITVVIADPAQTLLIRAGLPLSGRVTWFTVGNLFAAHASIQMNHPKVIAVEAVFAETPPGQEFLARIESLAIRGSAIQLVVRTQGRWTMVPYAGQAVAAAVSTEMPVTLDRLAAAAAQMKGANTRRASRFKILESLNAIVENGQATLVNISILGAQVVSQPSLKPTQNVKIILPDADEMLRLTAHVAWATYEQIQPGSAPHYRAGMEFTDAAQEILEDYCRRHCSQDPLPSY
jgi:PilZ domain